MMVIGLAVAAQQSAHAGIFVRIGGHGGYYAAAPGPVYYAPAYPAYPYPAAAPVCPPPAPVYAPAPVCAPAPVYYAPRPAYYSPASVGIAVPGVRLHIGHVHIWL